MAAASPSTAEGWTRPWRRDSVEAFFVLSNLSLKRAISKKRALCSVTLVVRSSSLESQEGTLSLRWTKLCRASIAEATRAMVIWEKGKVGKECAKV